MDIYKLIYDQPSVHTANMHGEKWPVGSLQNVFQAAEESHPLKFP